VEAGNQKPEAGMEALSAFIGVDRRPAFCLSAADERRSTPIMLGAM
jgi:hypothetical protein